MADPPEIPPTPRRARRPGLIALTIAAAATLALSLFLASRSATPTVLWIDLRTVSGDQLVSSGITLLPPPPGTEASAVPQSVAEQVSSDQWPGAEIEEVVLARLIALGPAPPIDRFAWVVSFDPTGPVGVPSHGGAPTGPASVARRDEQWVTDYALVFIDAQTGSFLFGSSQSHIVAP